jgi:citrate lyase gamma subunit
VFLNIDKISKKKKSFGGMANVLVGQPLDTIKVRLQLDQGKFKGAWDCTVQTVQKEGFFALYKGECLFAFIYLQ